MTSYTQYLLQSYKEEYAKATNHPFLQAAGDGSLNTGTFEKWLKQDYLYAHVGYKKYAGLLLSHLPYPAEPPSSFSSVRDRTLWNALPVLVFSLSNVQRETEFFTTTADKYGLSIFETPPQPKGSDLLDGYAEATKGYVEYLHSIGGTGTIEEGFVLLWAMEKAYYDSWSYAKAHRPLQRPSDGQKPQQAMWDMIDNWTSDEFKGFVDDCQSIVDGLLDKDHELARRCEQVFKRVLYLEQRFWPSL